MKYVSSAMQLHKPYPAQSHCCPISFSKAKGCGVNPSGTSTVSELMAAQDLFWAGVVCSTLWICGAREWVVLLLVGEDGQGAVSWPVVASSGCEAAVLPVRTLLLPA